MRMQGERGQVRQGPGEVGVERALVGRVHCPHGTVGEEGEGGDQESVDGKDEVR